MNNLDIMAIELVSWEVGVGGCGHHVVDEGNVFADILGGPVREEGVEQALVSAIKGTMSHGMFY